MASGKSERSKLVKILTSIIIIVMASIFGVEITDLLPNETVVSTEYGATTVEGEFIVHMIDVGQADAFLLIQGDEIALVDAGESSTGKDVVNYLKACGITKIDYLIGTHPHKDHMRGMLGVIVNFDIGTIIIPKVEEGKVTSNWYLNLMTKIKTGKYQVEYAEKGNLYSIGNATIEIIEAERNPGDNINNYSIVSKVSFGQIDMIMTGDAETKIEEKILNSGEDIDAEILKVGHHGSDTSSSEEFLDAVSPEYALISCEVGNKYEHPVKSTMEKLEERNIEVYRTDENGSVVMTITSDDISFNCEPGDYISGVELKERGSK